VHPDEDYWQKIVDDVSIREFAWGRPQKKSGLTSIGIPSIGFTGVWMAQEKKDIIDTLGYSLALTHLCPGFDMDFKSNKKASTSDYARLLEERYALRL